MQTLHVDLAHRAYPIHIGTGLLDRLPDLSGIVRHSQVFVITDDHVGPLHGARLEVALRRQGLSVQWLKLPAGEASKNAETLGRIHTFLLENHADRKSTVFALGGGVIGDLAGFAAATYMRGVDFVQLPTTLLAQVDSSVGGKTGINHPLGKNMIGAFHQPRMVIADLDCLHTLPPRELSAGLAEVLKHGAILDAHYFHDTVQQLPQLLALDDAALGRAVARSCEIKADVVRQDEREGGIRAWLNLGHTFGHAIEAALGYGVWLHGEAVGAGMVAAAELSKALGYLGDADVEQVRYAVQQAGLPVELPPIGVAKFLGLMASDKKADAGAIRYVVLKSIGQAANETVSDDIVGGVLRHLGQSA